MDSGDGDVNNRNIGEGSGFGERGIVGRGG